MVNRDRLQKLAGDERFIAGIYIIIVIDGVNVPKTQHCLNFALSANYAEADTGVFSPSKKKLFCTTDS